LLGLSRPRPNQRWINGAPWQPNWSPFDLLLLDGAKSVYTEVLRLVESRLRPGAFIDGDNVDSRPEYVAHVRSLENGYLSMRIG